MAYLGNTVQSELNGVEASSRADGDRQTQLILDSYFKPKTDKPRSGMFADPALLL